MICKSLILGCISSRMIGNNTKNGSTCNGVNGSYSSNRNITVSASQTITRLCSTCHLSLKLFQTVNKTICPLMFFLPQVAIEGNIGSGKTSLLKYFKQNSLVEVSYEIKGC